MARARNIKPGFFMNEDLTELPFEYRLLFIGLWTLADREGKLEDRPKRIKMELFPADSVDVDQGLSELERYGFVERYEVDGLRIVMILKFTDHQRPHHTEKASELPNKDGSLPVAEPKKAGKDTDKGGADNGEVTVKGALSDGGNPPDSLNPDSLIPDSLNNPPNPPAGGEGGDADAGGDEKPKRERKHRIKLKTFVEVCRANGEKPISEYQPLLDYVEATGLPMDYVQLAWEVFKDEFLPGGPNENRLQADWRRHFLNYVKKGYYRLWYAKPADHGTEYLLSTQGVQAQSLVTHREGAAA